MINEEDIIKRGYVTDEEYEEIRKEYGVERFSIKGDCPEGFWGAQLKSNPNLFVLFNDLISFIGGPRGTAGLVGYHNNHIMYIEESTDLFIKAGKEAIEYWRRSILSDNFDGEKKHSEEK